MEPDKPSLISRGGKPEGGAAPQPGGALEKFKALPMPAQVGIGVAAVALLWLMFGGRSVQTPQVPQGSPTMGVVGTGVQAVTSPTFGGLQTDRPALMDNVFEQNRRELSELREKVEEQFNQRDSALQAAQEQNQQLQQQMQQMMTDFTAEIKNMQAGREEDTARLSQLSEQQRQMELGAAVGDASIPAPSSANVARRTRITQASLGSPPQGFTKGLLSPLSAGLSGGLNGVSPQAGPITPAPFIPPLGFVEATLLNGVDALTGGSATPALARISGNYNTAMNGTVALDGCVVMMEFSGNLATERATGKPLRMTCVFPDGGAATYALEGYVVDAEDGVIGVPGLLYEGDPARIGASIVADFLAGIGEIVEKNQNTTQTSTQNGVNTTTVTGDELKGELAGGANKAFGSIRDYLKQRVDRTTPFIRIDALRTVNLVILNGQEIRTNGSPWTTLFDGAKADQQLKASGGANNTVRP